MNKGERGKRRHALKDTIDQYYAKEMLTALLANGFSETEICAEFMRMIKQICKEEEGIKNETK